MEKSRHIVYGLIDPRNNELRYVGKSSKGMSRPKHHHTPCGRNSKTYNGTWLRSLWSDNNTKPSIIVLSECLSDEHVLSEEKRLIAYFLDHDFALTNLTFGGEGCEGHKHKNPMSDEQKQKIRMFFLGKKRSLEDRLAMSMAMKGKKRRPPSEATKRKIGDAHRGKKLSQQQCELMRNRVISQETRDKLSIANLGKTLTPEHREKIRASVTKTKRLRKVQHLDLQGQETFDNVFFSTEPTNQERRIT